MLQQLANTSGSERLVFVCSTSLGSFPLGSSLWTFLWHLRPSKAFHSSDFTRGKHGGSGPPRHIKQHDCTCSSFSRSYFGTFSWRSRRLVSFFCLVSVSWWFFCVSVLVDATCASALGEGITSLFLQKVHIRNHVTGLSARAVHLFSPNMFKEHAVCKISPLHVSRLETAVRWVLFPYSSHFKFIILLWNCSNEWRLSVCSLPQLSFTLDVKLGETRSMSWWVSVAQFCPMTAILSWAVEDILNFFVNITAFLAAVEDQFASVSCC